MKALRMFISLVCLTPVLLLARANPPRVGRWHASSLQPPPLAAVEPVTDVYYGTKVVDPYRYMENLDDPEVRSWVKAENDYTRALLGSLTGRQRLLKRIAELDLAAAGDVGRVRRLPGEVYLYTKLRSGEVTYKLYIRKGLTGKEKLLLDPEKVTVNEHSREKGKNAIGIFVPSNDLRYVAVTVIPGGSEDDAEIHVVETASGRETGDVIHRCCIKSDLVWLPDNRSFTYGRLQDLLPHAPPNEVRQKYRAYVHTLGSDPQKDAVVFGYGVVSSIAVNPRLFPAIRVQPGSKYALGVIGLPIAQPNSAFYIALSSAIGSSNTEWRKIADLSDDVADIAIHGDDLYVLTFKDAPRYKILRLNARNPKLETAQTVVPAGKAVIEDMSAAQDALYVHVLDGGIGRVLRIPYRHGAKIEQVTIPFNGNASLFGTDPRVPGTLLLVNSWTRAYRIYAYDPKTRKTDNTRLQPAGAYDHFSNVEEEEVRVKSHDGVLVPLSIVHPKNMKRDGSNPTLLYGYGAYGRSQSPEFDFPRLAWFERGGIYATCHVRGGGEFGEEWHDAGKRQTKSNTWLDFIACAQYLIDKKYTSPLNLGGEGASMGAIMVGRAITVRPDLFAAVIVNAGIEDMLRAEAADLLDEAEQGSTKTEEGFKALYAMGPYYFVRDRTRYPAALFTAGINDSRLKPWQSAKMAARLQAATTSGRPVLLYIDYAGGHDEGITEQEYDERLANAWSFLLWQFGASEFQPR